MKILINCLLVVISGFVFWQFAVIYEKGFWSCHLDFISMVIISGIMTGIAGLGVWLAFRKQETPLRSRIIGIFIIAVSLTILLVEFIPAFFTGGKIYGSETRKLVLLSEMFLSGGIFVFGLVNLMIDLKRK